MPRQLPAPGPAPARECHAVMCPPPVAGIGKGQKCHSAGKLQSDSSKSPSDAWDWSQPAAPSRQST